MSTRETLPRTDTVYEPEATERIDLVGLAEDDQKTVLVPTERTVVQPAGEFDPVTVRELERERRRAEREQALGTRRKAVAPVQEQAQSVHPKASSAHPKAKRTTDKFFGSAGLFLLRVVTAAIIGLHGFAKALDPTGVERMLTGTVIPEPGIMTYVVTGAEIAIALALLFGLMTRLAGFGLAAIGIGALVFVHWTTNPFTGNLLAGELELLLGGVGVLFVCLGAGGWSVDRAVRRRNSAAH